MQPPKYIPRAVLALTIIALFLEVVVYIKKKPFHSAIWDKKLQKITKDLEVKDFQPLEEIQGDISFTHDFIEENVETFRNLSEKMAEILHKNDEIGGTVVCR